MININTKELYRVLEATPDSQNVMLVGKHGIGKSQILSHFYGQKGMRVIALFLGQMSDPGDLIGLPRLNETTGRTEFMPPYWFPTTDEPIVLFLDELNRARPEVLQTIMDLALNRRLAGRDLPAGSRLISAVNDGEEYQLTDLDPALVSRFNIYNFRPTADEWLLWAKSSEVDDRVIQFITDNNTWLDSEGGTRIQLDTGLEKSPDRRAWVKVSDIIKTKDQLTTADAKIIAGVVGVKAAQLFMASVNGKQTVTAKQVLESFDTVKDKLAKYKVHELVVVNGALMRHMEAELPSASTRKKNLWAKNFVAYVTMLSQDHREALGELANTYGSGAYPQTMSFIITNARDAYSAFIGFTKMA